MVFLRMIGLFLPFFLGLPAQAGDSAGTFKTFFVYSVSEDLSYSIELELGEEHRGRLITSFGSSPIYHYDPSTYQVTPLHGDFENFNIKIETRSDGIRKVSYTNRAVEEPEQTVDDRRQEKSFEQVQRVEKLMDIVISVTDGQVHLTETWQSCEVYTRKRIRHHDCTFLKLVYEHRLTWSKSPAPTLLR